MNRAERQAAKEEELKQTLADQEATYRLDRETTLKAIAKAKQAQREEERKALVRRQAGVGKLVASAGLFALDDATLGCLFEVLAPLAQVPNPVARLASLIAPDTSLLPAPEDAP
jgi:hypothetical protein